MVCAWRRALERRHVIVRLYWTFHTDALLPASVPFVAKAATRLARLAVGIGTGTTWHTRTICRISVPSAGITACPSGIWLSAGTTLLALFGRVAITVLTGAVAGFALGRMRFVRGRVK